MERILVAVDFSDCSRRAFGMAVELARTFDALLHVVYVAPEIFEKLEASELILPVRPEASQMERELVDLVLKEFKGNADEFARIDKKILQGIDHRAILAEAERVQPSLIVAGTHGRSRLERMFLGSVSDRLLRGAKAPVLLVPEPAMSRPKKLLVAVDGDVESTERLLREAGRWATALEAQLTVLQVMEDSMIADLPGAYENMVPATYLSQWAAQVQQSLEWTVAKNFPVAGRPAVEIRRGRAHREICGFAEEGGFDLIVMGGHGNLNPGVGPTTLRVAHRCPCAVLVTREAKGV